MAAILTVQNLRKRYGKLDAVQNLSFEVEQGSVFGFIGPNGAGKTTTMRILTTLLKPTSGEAWVAGHSITRDPRGVRRAIGYMPDFFGADFWAAHAEQSALQPGAGRRWDGVGICARRPVR